MLANFLNDDQSYLYVLEESSNFQHYEIIDNVSQNCEIEPGESEPNHEINQTADSVYYFLPVVLIIIYQVLPKKHL